jgi:predicted enzyme related to lactoylglutathione lyase
MSIENSVVFLPCENIEATTVFYRDVVGLPLVQEQSGGICRIFDTGYGYFGFCEYGDGRPIPNGAVGVCLSLNCHNEADVDKQYNRMTANGCEILMAPSIQNKFPVYAFFVRDPSGYKLEFQRILLENQQLTGGRPAQD